jgi:hypothetical protein
VTRRLLGAFPLVLLAACLVAVGTRAGRIGSDVDLWWHLRLGSDFMEQGNLRPPQHWSSLATQSWVPTEPLPEIVAAIAHKWAGFDGVVWLFAVASMLVLLTVYVTNRAVSRPLAAALASTFCILGCSLSLTPRPQLVSFILLPLALRAWNRTAVDLQPRWYLIPLMYGWSLCHGFWFIGVGYGFLEIVGVVADRRVRARQASALVLVAALSGLAVLFNPVGIGVFEAPLAVHDTMGYIDEWRHPTLASGAVVIVLLMIAGVVVTWALNRTLWSWRRTFLLVSCLFWLWYAWRTVALASLVVAPLLAEAIEIWLQRAARGDASSDAWSVRGERRVVAGSAVLCAVALTAVVPALATPPDAHSPVDRALDALPPGSVVFNRYEMGGWIAWRHPDLNQVIDGLVTPYATSYVDGYIRTMRVEPGWFRFVQATGAHVALLGQDDRLAQALHRKGWVSTATYQGYVVLEEPPTSH